MIRLKPWQWAVLALPIASTIVFIVFAAGWQIHEWGLSWIWAIFTLIFVAWRWLIVQWTNPAVKEIEAAIAQVNQELESNLEARSTGEGDTTGQAETILRDILEKAKDDPPVWQDWTTFWQRCQEIVTAIAHIYYPEERYPLLNIYVPQAYSLIRGTVDALDQWMQKLGPALNQVTVGQAYQAYEVYQKLEPSARKLWQVWNWAQWLLNPAAAAARQATKKSGDKATQQLLVNLGQLFREAALRNLCQQAIALYSGKKIAIPEAVEVPEAKTQTLRDIIIQAEPVAQVEQKPVNILLVGRTGAGKSSLINTLFQAEKAEVDVLPSTDRIKNYHWATPTGETLTLWDTPGYEQVNRADFKSSVSDYAANADLLILVTPALDPALEMDVEFLKDIKSEIEALPTIAVVTQVDRLRPLREWQPPYDWQWGERPKEIAIREATEYRSKLLGEFVKKTLPIVTKDLNGDRPSWNIDILSLSLVEAIAPAKQIRLARFLRDRESRIVGAAKIIDRYTFQMATTQGLTTFLKSPILSFIATLTTGTPTAAYILAQQIPIEQLPVVIGKLQMAYDLFSLLTSDRPDAFFDLRSLWPLLLENPISPELNAWAFGHALVEYWTQNLTVERLKEQYEYYLKQAEV